MIASSSENWQIFFRSSLFIQALGLGIQSLSNRTNVEHLF